MRARPWYVLLLLLLLAAHLAVGMAWISRDRIVRDGDEEGHVGAAELVLDAWRSGRPLDAVQMSLWGELGEYPPLYAGIQGAWWAVAGGGDPARPAVRGVNLLWPLLAALSVWSLARPLGGVPALGAMASVLLLPEVTGLGWHFMPEGPLVAAVALAVTGIVALGRKPGIARILLCGASLAVAFLVKQTAVVYLAPVLAAAMASNEPGAWRRRGCVGVAVAVAIPCVAPWLVPHLEAQWSYGVAAVEGPSGIALLDHLTFYPRSIFWAGAGPGLAVVGLVGVGVAVSAVRRGGEPGRIAVLAGAWLVGSVLLLVLIPRKYPRLAAPALPAVGLLVALLLARNGWSRVLAWTGLAAAAGWWVWGTSRPLPIPASALTLDARCPQRWFRPPIEDDLGIGDVVEASRTAPPGVVRVVDSPAIPCDVQTSFDWDAHLGPALRRAGVDRLVTLEGPLGDAALVVSFAGAPPGGLGVERPVPLLDATMWIGRIGW